LLSEARTVVIHGLFEARVALEHLAVDVDCVYARLVVAVRFARVVEEAMSPVPPATSMDRMGSFAPGRRRETKESFQRWCTPSDMVSFMRS
jgi:hypothetical protein